MPLTNEKNPVNIYFDKLILLRTCNLIVTLSLELRALNKICFSIICHHTDKKLIWMANNLLLPKDRVAAIHDQGPRGGLCFGVKLVRIFLSLESETLTCSELRYVIDASIQAKN